MNGTPLNAPTVCPVVLRGAFGDRKWSLTIQSEPTPRIYRTGDMPTKLEMFEVVAYSMLPAGMAHVFMVCAELAEVVE